MPESGRYRVVGGWPKVVILPGDVGHLGPASSAEASSVSSRTDRLSQTGLVHLDDVLGTRPSTLSHDSPRRSSIRVVQEEPREVYTYMPVDDFDAFIDRVRPRLARAFVAAYGPDRGEEALAEAMAAAWERFDEVPWMENPAGFLYRVGQTRSKPRRSVQSTRFPMPENLGLPNIEPALPGALERLTERQRVSLVLVHGFGWTHQEVADLLGVARTSVQNHVERGLQRIRSEMGVAPRA